jgi:cobalt-zinc-cadmium resistance protein CzcA
VGEVIDGQRRFPMVIRLPDAQRTRVEALADLLIPASTGALVPLRQLATIVETEGPATVSREWGRRLIRVQTNVRGRDVASFVAEARRRVAEEVDLPEGYIIEWGGQFENLERSQRRLLIVVPLTLLAVFLMLHLSLKSVRDVLIIYTGIPLAAVGGVLALWVRGMPFSVSAAVGFIALCGIVVLNGQLLVSGIRQRLGTGLPMIDAVKEAGRSRLQPILATAVTDAVGFIPMALSTGVGSEVQRPLATVVIGGVLTSTLLTLFVMPILYMLAGRGRAGTTDGIEAEASAEAVPVRDAGMGQSKEAALPEGG